MISIPMHTNVSAVQVGNPPAAYVDRLQRFTIMGGEAFWASRIAKREEGWTVEDHRPLAPVKLFSERARGPYLDKSRGGAAVVTGPGDPKGQD